MLILNQPCEFDYKAFTNCDVYTITYEVYHQICQAYPEEAEKVLINTKNRYATWKDTSKRWLRKVGKRDTEVGKRKSSFAFFMQESTDIREDANIPSNTHEAASVQPTKGSSTKSINK
eukprot:NODE_19_length_39463_cov_0.396073.p24 type:complete len:118 gc:universal NODE_19_length_39463_cov_0.396073:4191-4544(+)